MTQPNPRIAQPNPTKPAKHFNLPNEHNPARVSNPTRETREFSQPDPIRPGIYGDVKNWSQFLVKIGINLVFPFETILETDRFQIDQIML